MPHGRGRACPARRYKADGRLRESRGPGMPGPEEYGGRAFTGKPRAGHARPLPTLRFTPLFYCKTNPHPGAGLAGRTGVGVVGFRRL